MAGNPETAGHQRDVTQRLKVVHVITSLGSGGAQSMLMRIATGNYDAKGPEQVVISLMDEDLHGDALRASGIPVRSLGMRGGLDSIALAWRLFRVLKAERPDVLMTWLYHADLIGTMMARASGTKRVVWNLRCSEMYLDGSRPLSRLGVRLLARMSRLPTAIAANSEAGKEAHKRLGYAPRRWLHLPNGFDLDVWRPDEADRAAVRAELGFDESDIVIGMVARVDPLKDHATFIAAATRLVERYPNVRFVLAGRGTRSLPIPASLSERLVALEERSDLPRLVRAFDVAVLSSLSEGFPNVIAEAMASAVPCIASDVGDSALMLQDVGIVVPPRDAASLMNAMERLIMATPTERRDAGRRSRSKVESNWSLKKSVEAYRAAWQEVMLSEA